MTTETKPIIDLSEWEECTERKWAEILGEDSARIQIGREIRFFCRKPKPVKSLEEKIKTFMRSCCAFSEGQARDLLDIASIIEEHIGDLIKEDK